MTPTRTSVLLVIAAVCALVSWLVLRLLYSALPPLPWTGVPALAIAAAAEAWTGHLLRARILGRPGTKRRRPSTWPGWRCWPRRRHRRPR